MNIESWVSIANGQPLMEVEGTEILNFVALSSFAYIFRPVALLQLATHKGYCTLIRLNNLKTVPSEIRVRLSQNYAP